MIDPWHAGERAAHSRAGVEEQAEWAAQHAIWTEIPAVAAKFLSKQPMVVAAHRARDGLVWASLLQGEPGFVHVIDAGHVHFASPPQPDDALTDALGLGPVPLGVLAIDLTLRRRMRLNGTAERHGDGVDFRAEQVYANCPKYITVRAPARLDDPTPPRQAAESADRLSTEDLQLLSESDTFFIATAHSEGGADASHRGGNPGFLEVVDDTHLTWPDYPGNGMLMTIGNLEVESAVGLLIIDWASGDVVQIAGQARTDWDPARAESFPGAERVMDLTVDKVVRHSAALNRQWYSKDRSPFNPPVRSGPPTAPRSS